MGIVCKAKDTKLIWAFQSTQPPRDDDFLKKRTHTNVALVFESQVPASVGPVK